MIERARNLAEQTRFPPDAFVDTYSKRRRPDTLPPPLNPFETDFETGADDEKTEQEEEAEEEEDANAPVAKVKKESKASSRKCVLVLTILSRRRSSPF